MVFPGEWFEKVLTNVYENTFGLIPGGYEYSGAIAPAAGFLSTLLVGHAVSPVARRLIRAASPTKISDVGMKGIQATVSIGVMLIPLIIGGADYDDGVRFLKEQTEMAMTSIHLSVGGGVGGLLELAFPNMPNPIKGTVKKAFSSTTTAIKSLEKMVSRS